MTGEHDPTGSTETPTRRYSRRALLGAGATGLAALAGCSALPGNDETDARRFDDDALTTMADADPPRPPSAFPLSVPTERVEAHRSRAASLLSQVPAEPDVPNALVEQQVAEERARVADELAVSPDDARTMLDRLGHWRRRRVEAATVAGMYAAARATTSSDAVRERRERLRQAQFGFREEWTYTASDPVDALGVHAEVESLLEEVTDAFRPREAYPADPPADVEAAGRVVGELEGGEAALGDARTLVDAVRTDGENLAGYRPHLRAAALRLERVAERSFRDVHSAVNHEMQDPAAYFDGSLDGVSTALFERAREMIAYRSDVPHDSIRNRQYANACVDAATVLTAIEAFRDSVARIEADRVVTPPEGAAAVREARKRAVTAVESSWDERPRLVSRSLAGVAAAILEDGDRWVSRTDSVEGDEADRAVANYVYVRLFAETIPAATTYVGDIVAEPDVATPRYGRE